MKIPAPVFGLFFLLLCLLSCASVNEGTTVQESYDVIVYGNGTGAVTAAIQAARGEANTLLISPCPWLGGMVSSAGVSATDGNHRLPSGLWGEFRDKIYEHYGGPDSVFTGWVSNTNFEPHVADSIWKELANQTDHLTIVYDQDIKQVIEDSLWTVTILDNDQSKQYHCRVLIDGTDLGDVMSMVNLDYDIGWDQDITAPIGFEGGRDYIQDLTYCAVLKDYGTPQNIKPPAGYTPDEFRCCCQHDCTLEDVHDCETMLNYARLPNQKYLLNWPIRGNDLFPTTDVFDQEKRQQILKEAKEKTLRFAYYIHDELKFHNLWLANDEFQTPDLLPYEAYYREARRMVGQARFSIHHVLQPYQTSLYRTGIAVGDYPVDHHHDEYPGHTQRSDFPSIPSFTIPLGSIIPDARKNFLVADKSISVTHEANGTTRLQPVIMQVGQAAGALAALAVQRSKLVQEISVREVQTVLLGSGVYLQPFLDVPSQSQYFEAIQRVGCTGLLRGVGVPFQWANQTWFYPDTSIEKFVFLDHIYEVFPQFNKSKRSSRAGKLSINEAFELLWELKTIARSNLTINKSEYLDLLQLKWKELFSKPLQWDAPILKKEMALLLDIEIDPFNRFPVNIHGEFLPQAEDK